MFMVCVCTMKWTVPSEWHWSGDCIFASVQIFYLTSSGYSISKGREGNVQDCFWELCLLHLWLLHRFQKKYFHAPRFSVRSLRISSTWIIVFGCSILVWLQCSFVIQIMGFLPVESWISCYCNIIINDCILFFHGSVCSFIRIAIL